jgi:hypothetical protein
MAFARFTRPDDSPVSINTDEILSLAPVPTDGPLMGPLKAGTRIAFKNGKHQDVKELIGAVEIALNTATGGGSRSD